MIPVPEGVLERARTGDAAAFRVLVETFQKPVYQTVFRLIGGRYADAVEDVAQDVFLKVFRSIDSFDAARGVRFSTWLYTFVRNQCFDFLKKRRLPMQPLDAGSRSDDKASFDLPSSSAEPGERALEGELNEQIGRAVANLPDDQRAAFVLREYQGLEYREIAAITGASEGTVKSRIYRAKEALRNALKRYVLQP